MKRIFQALTLVLAVGALIQTISSRVSAEAKEPREKVEAHEPGI